MTTIWIEDGCIACSACVDVAPEIFAMDGNDTCIVIGMVRADGIDSDNRSERSPLKPGLAETHAAAIEDAVTGCPTECIKIT